jgi:hypothetical protein
MTNPPTNGNGEPVTAWPDNVYIAINENLKQICSLLAEATTKAIEIRNEGSPPDPQPHMADDSESWEIYSRGQLLLDAIGIAHHLAVEMRGAYPDPRPPQYPDGEPPF